MSITFDDILTLKRNSRVINGHYQSKPLEYRTLNSWLNSGKKPISMYVGAIYETTNNTGGFMYYSPSEVEDMTPEEITKYNEFVNQQREQMLKKMNSEQRKSNLENPNVINSSKNNYHFQRNKTYDKSNNNIKKSSNNYYPYLEPDLFSTKYTVALAITSPNYNDSFPKVSRITIVDEVGIVFDQAFKIEKKSKYDNNLPYISEMADTIHKILKRADVIACYNPNFDISAIENNTGITINKNKIFNVYDVFTKSVKGKGFKLEDAFAYYKPQFKAYFKKDRLNPVQRARCTFMCFQEQARQIILRELDAKLDTIVPKKEENETENNLEDYELDR